MLRPIFGFDFNRRNYLTFFEGYFGAVIALGPIVFVGFQFTAIQWSITVLNFKIGLWFDGGEW